MRSSRVVTILLVEDDEVDVKALKWAFGFYGGDYWVFLEKDPASDIFGTSPETHTTVYEVSPTGQLMGQATVGQHHFVEAFGELASHAFPVRRQLHGEVALFDCLHCRHDDLHRVGLGHAAGAAAGGSGRRGRPSG